MRETIYIQAGSLANHVGTHFWNTQQCYFSYRDGEEILVDHDISFREGVSSAGEATYHPRVLVLDRKANFGTLSRSNNAFQDGTSDAIESTMPLWDKATDEVRQETVPESSYQKALEEEVEEDLEDMSKGHTPTLPGPTFDRSEMRYWSDYRRVYYHPRSLHMLPDTSDFENSGDDWDAGEAMFERYDLDHSFMEDSFRHFVEESDSCQGVNIIADASFGSFSLAVLTAIDDEYPNFTSVSFPIMGSPTPLSANLGNLRSTRKIFNDAKRLSLLGELCSLNIPLEDPYSWTPGPWSDDLDLSFSSPFESAGILSAHIESATLPLRLKDFTPLPNFCSQLNYCGTTPFAELSGALPVESLDRLDERLQNFTWSISRERQEVRQLSSVSNLLFRRDMIRGFENSASLERMKAMRNTMTAPITSVFAPVPYPLPTSFPFLFRTPLFNDRSRLTQKGIISKNRTIPLVSSFGLHSDGLPALLESYATYMEDCIRNKVQWNMVGAEQDDAQELAAQLWTMHDNFGIARLSSDVEEIDVDEEF